MGTPESTGIPLNPDIFLIWLVIWLDWDFCISRELALGKIPNILEAPPGRVGQPLYVALDHTSKTHYSTV